MRLISSMAVLLLAASCGCGRPLTSVDQAIERVSRRAPIGIYGQVYEDNLQVPSRLYELNNYYTGFCYRFKGVDREAWKALMANQQASMYARLCAAWFLLDDDEESRIFVKQQLTSDNLRYRYNAAELVHLYVGGDPSKTWGVDLLTEMLANGWLDVHKQEERDTGHVLRDFPDGDWQDINRNPIERIREDLKLVKDHPRRRPTAPTPPPKEPTMNQEPSK